MPSAPRPEPDRPDSEPEAPRRKFRHLRPVEDEPDEMTRHGHGSGCIPVILIRLSILALLIYLICLIAGLVLSRRTHEAPRPAAPAAQAPAPSKPQ